MASFQASFKEIDLQRADISKDKNDFEHRLLKPMKMSEMNEPEKVLHSIRSKVNWFLLLTSGGLFTQLQREYKANAMGIFRRKESFILKNVPLTTSRIVYGLTANWSLSYWLVQTVFEIET